MPDAAVLIHDGRISAVGPRQTVSRPANADVIDVSGLTLLPGLIDGHDHLASHGYAMTQRWGLHEPQYGAYAHGHSTAADPGYWLYTMRDAAGLDVGFKLAVEEGLISGPRLMLAVSIISPTSGIGDRVSPSGHDCCIVLDPTLPSGVANGIHEVQQVVRSMVRAGADVIKCATTGGASSRPAAAPQRYRLYQGRDACVGGRIARLGPACHVPRPGWTGPAHGHRSRG